MKSILLVVGIIGIGCAGHRANQVNSVSEKRTVEVKYLDDNTYRLESAAQDQAYGYDKNHPIEVGGIIERSGPKNERRFLNALLGPKGEEIRYVRVGSCCSFKTPNGMIDDTGLLDFFKVYWKGKKDTLTIYMNMYDKGDLKIPYGFTAKKEITSK